MTIASVFSLYLFVCLSHYLYICLCFLSLSLLYDSMAGIASSSTARVGVVRSMGCNKVPNRIATAAKMIAEMLLPLVSDVAGSSPGDDGTDWDGSCRGENVSFFPLVFDFLNFSFLFDFCE